MENYEIRLVAPEQAPTDDPARLSEFLARKIAEINAVANHLYEVANMNTPSDFFTEVMKGNVEGQSGTLRFGITPDLDISDGSIEVWDGSAKYVAPTFERIHQVVSDEVGDSATLVVGGVGTDDDPTGVIDTTKDFVALGVVAGDVLLDDTHTTVGRVISVTTNKITANLLNPTTGFPHAGVAAGDAYRVARGSGSGIAAIYAYGTGIARDERAEFIIPNGTTDVATVNAYARLNLMRVFGGTSGALGNITMTADVDGTITCQITQFNNQSMMAIYTIPAGKQAYVLGWHVSIAKKSTATIAAVLKGGQIDGIPFPIQPVQLHTQGANNFTHDFRLPFPFPGGTDIWVEAETDSNSVAVSAGFDILLVDAQ